MDNVIVSFMEFYPIHAYYPIKGRLANNVDPDQMPQNAASDQGLYYLHETSGYFSLV